MGQVFQFCPFKKKNLPYSWACCRLTRLLKPPSRFARQTCLLLWLSPARSLPSGWRSRRRRRGSSSAARARALLPLYGCWKPGPRPAAVPQTSPRPRPRRSGNSSPSVSKVLPQPARRSEAARPRPSRPALPPVPTTGPARLRRGPHPCVGPGAPIGCQVPGRRGARAAAAGRERPGGAARGAPGSGRSRARAGRSSPRPRLAAPAHLPKPVV